MITKTFILMEFPSKIANSSHSVNINMNIIIKKSVFCTPKYIPVLQLANITIRFIFNKKYFRYQNYMI